MSNQQVGMVFDRVIQEVCDSSQVDFEESGVDQQTLLDMRRSWQKKLSSLGVAHFPWDPPPPQLTPSPAQTPVLAPNTTVPSNAPRPAHPSQLQQHDLSQFSQTYPATAPPLQAPVPQAPPVAPTVQAPRIKTEPGVNGHSGYPPMHMLPPQPPNSQSAQERAASMLQQRFGAAAANSVNQLQAQSQAALGMPGQQQRFQNPQVPNGQIQGQPPATNEQHGHPVNTTQTDGASDSSMSDWKAEVLARRRAAESQNGEGDRLLREHLRQRMSQLEGGGLLLPLDEHRSPRPSTRNLGNTGPSVPAEPGSSSDLSGSELTGSKPQPLGAQFDGPGDDDDDDAINSDLDDPEDVVNDEQEGDESVGQVMLCTYDKVQRVKSKWKCTLKDGILTTGGKEYVFHKGQGEFEW